MSYRKVQATLLAILALVGGFLALSPVQGENYALSISPHRTQESNSPGVAMSLTVTGASPLQFYTFQWVVLDPSGNGKNAQTTSAGGQSSFTMNVVYPTDFGGGASIGYVGRYTVTVIQTAPAFNPNVASGDFEAGLTDLTSYVRTSPVSIKATNYASNEDVTIDISRGGSSAPGFPRPVRTDANGNFVFTWQTLSSTLAGNYTVNLTGTITPAKSPPDSQSFLVQTANLNVAVTSTSSTLGPGQVLPIYATVSYPDGTSMTQGTVTTALSLSGFQVGPLLALGYDQAQGRWTGSYTVKDTDPTGIWLVQVSASDQYSNTGQGSVSAFASISPIQQQSPLTSIWFLGVLDAIAVGAFFAFVLFKRRGVTATHLKVDLQAVGREADRVMNQDFFRSLREQVQQRKNGSREETDG